MSFTVTLSILCAFSFSQLVLSGGPVEFRITATSGNYLFGAEIEITEVGSNKFIGVARSDRSGVARYSFRETGQYRLKTSLRGFSVDVTEVYVDLNRPLRIPISLRTSGSITGLGMFDLTVNAGKVGLDLSKDITVLAIGVESRVKAELVCDISVCKSGSLPLGYYYLVVIRDDKCLSFIKLFLREGLNEGNLSLITDGL